MVVVHTCVPMGINLSHHSIYIYFLGKVLKLNIFTSGLLSELLGKMQDVWFVKTGICYLQVVK